MKKVKLKWLALENFKQHKALKVDFHEVATVISAANRKGKSTIGHAFSWLLFGKDMFGRTNHKITPIVNNVVQTKLSSTVSAMLTVDGQEVQLSRTLIPVWTKKRGATEAVLTGTTTDYVINEMPSKQKDYNAYIDSIISEDVFRMITNPLEFFALDWKKQREYLFAVAKVSTDEELAAGKPEFERLLDSLSGRSLEDYRKVLATKRKKLNDALKLIQPRIDQTNKLMPDAKDWAKLETEKATLETEIASIEAKLSGKASDEAANAEQARISAIQKQIFDIRIKQLGIVTAERLKRTDAANKANEAYNKLMQDIKHCNDKISSLGATIEIQEPIVKQLTEAVTDASAKTEALRKQWKDIKASDFVASETITCPLFKHTCADSKAIESHKANNEQAAINFASNKASQLAEINKSGKALSESLNAMQSKLSEASEQLERAKIDKELEQSNLTDLQKALKRTSKAVPEDVIPSTLHEWCALEEKAAKLEADKQPKPDAEADELQAKKDKATTKLDSVKSELAERETIKKHKAEIDSLEAEGKALVQQISSIEQQEMTCEAFTAAKIDDLDSKVNGMFESIRFEFFDYTYEGGAKETCRAINEHGVPVSAFSTSEAINAGLEVINVLNKFYGVSAPIFADNAESVNEYIETDNQIVFLKVSDSQEINVYSA